MNLVEAAADRAFRAAVRDWMATELAGEFAPLREARGPGAPGFDLDLARRWEQRLAAGGWVGIGWPRAAGGDGLPLSQQLVFHEEYVRAGGPGRIGHIGETLLAPTLIEHGSAALRERFLPAIRAGTEYWAQGYSEPGAGSDLANVQTRATLAHGTWVLRGQKLWTSWAREADWIFVLARSEAGSKRHQGLTLLLVPLRQPGIEVRPIRQIGGGAEFNEVYFDGARTEGWMHLGDCGQGWRVAMSLLGHERGASTLGQQAHFRRELECMVDLARRRGADAVLRRRLARAALGLQMLRRHALRVLGAPPSTSGSTATGAALVSKYAWSNWHRDLGRLAADLLGADADVVADDDPGSDPDPDRSALQQLWLSSRADTIYAGTNEIQLNLIAERGLGMPR